MANFHLGWLTKKGPHKSPKYNVFPALFEKTWDLWGAFLADQSKWKELGSTWLAASWFYFWPKFKVVSAGQHLRFSVLSLWQPEHHGQQWDPGPGVTSESQLSSWVGLKKHHKARKIMCLSYDFWRVSWLAGVFFKPAQNGTVIESSGFLTNVWKLRTRSSRLFLTKIVHWAMGQDTSAKGSSKIPMDTFSRASAVEFKTKGSWPCGYIPKSTPKVLGKNETSRITGI